MAASDLLPKVTSSFFTWDYIDLKIYCSYCFPISTWNSFSFILNYKNTSSAIALNLGFYKFSDRNSNTFSKYFSANLEASTMSSSYYYRYFSRWLRNFGLRNTCWFIGLEIYSILKTDSFGNKFDWVTFLKLMTRELSTGVAKWRFWETSEDFWKF